MYESTLVSDSVIAVRSPRTSRYLKLSQHTFYIIPGTYVPISCKCVWRHLYVRMRVRNALLGFVPCKGVLETLGNQLKQLDEEIKADEDGKQGFERRIAQVGLVLRTNGKLKQLIF